MMQNNYKANIKEFQYADGSMRVHTCHRYKNLKYWNSDDWELVGFIYTHMGEWTPSLEKRTRFSLCGTPSHCTVYNDHGKYIALSGTDSDEVEYCTMTQIRQLKDAVQNGKIKLFKPCSLEIPHITVSEFLHNFWRK